MHRFFEDTSSIFEDKIYLKKSNIHHFNVLRIKNDEDFEIVIDGIVYIVNAISTDKNEVICKIISKKKGENESKIKINLYQGLPKSDKLEFIIQKGVELGINSIIPFTSSRTIVKWNDKKENKKLIRYSEVSESAAKQSKRDVIPTIEASVSFNEMINRLKDKFTIVAYENRGETLREVLASNTTDEFNIVIGPEGGFSEQEIKQLEEIGANIINLGNRILRTETAAIALTTMIQYECGDINIKN